MSKLIKYTLPDESSILVEVEDTRGGTSPVSRGERLVEQANQTFEEALDTVRPATETIISKLRGLSVSPDEVEVKFSIKFTGESNVVIAKTAIEGNFEIKIKWTRQESSGRIQKTQP